MSQALLKPFVDALKELEASLKVAKRNDVSLASHSFYSRKVRSTLAALWKAFRGLKLSNPPDQHPGVAYQLATIEPVVQRLVSMYPTEPASKMLPVVREIQFKADSDLAAELDQLEATHSKPTSTLFLPEDIFDTRHGVLRKILWEVNTSYAGECYNGSATMLRRILENLIIEAFEHRGIGAKIVASDGSYLKLEKLIDRTVAEPKLRLTTNTKRLLPQLKFFGDLGAHNRLALVRKGDLERLHGAIRVGFEELATHLP
jgi:hypothetical protein